MNSQKGKKRKGKSIYKELNTLTIPDNIKKKADEIYSKMQIPVRRGQPRLQMFFACICYAYRELKIPHNQRKIARNISLSTDKIPESFKLYSFIKTGYKPHVYRQTYIDHIPVFYKFTGLTDGEEENIIKIGTSVTNKDQTLLGKDPVCLAGSLIIYYMQLRGLPVNNEIMEEIGLTHATVNNMVSSVAIAYNS
uniref:Transcription initiation factor IIB n=1 Tax=Pithovirus LCPAC101 TaxID=2506586 RepID=A0A481Z358_9VIRU|nr:MAG: transcription initiation factor IIB [Pithovirus LCPAC101]